MYDYIKHLRWAKLKVGLVVTVALVIIIFTVMFAGNIEKIFMPKTVILASFHDVKGLREGSPVWFAGVEIGAVKSINFTMDENIKVEMSIDADSLQYLKQDSKAIIMTLGLLGDKYVEISPGGYSSAGLKEGEYIEGGSKTEIQDVVQTSQASIEKISDFVGMLEEIIVKIDKGQGSVSKFIKDPAVYDNLRDAIDELSTLVRKIEDGNGTVGRLLNEDDIYNDLSASVDDIKLFARELRGSEGTLNKIIKDPSLFDRFQKASESLDTFTSKLASSRGTINRLIEDESLYININSASKNLSSLIEHIEKGEGVMGSLIKDDELSKELKTTVVELNALIKDIKERPGKYFKFSLF
jgi:phospholipid/cholesterol/gamma-HCH transport system substrate-binding protein